jgi:hypothetical protein
MDFFCPMLASHRKNALKITHRWRIAKMTKIAWFSVYKKFEQYAMIENVFHIRKVWQIYYNFSYGQMLQGYWFIKVRPFTSLKLWRVKTTCISGNSYFIYLSIYLNLYVYLFSTSSLWNVCWKYEIVKEKRCCLFLVSPPFVLTN